MKCGAGAYDIHLAIETVENSTVSFMSVISKHHFLKLIACVRNVKINAVYHTISQKLLFTDFTPMNPYFSENMVINMQPRYSYGKRFRS